MLLRRNLHLTQTLFYRGRRAQLHFVTTQMINVIWKIRVQKLSQWFVLKSKNGFYCLNVRSWVLLGDLILFSSILLSQIPLFILVSHLNEHSLHSEEFYVVSITHFHVSLSQLKDACYFI